MNPYISIIVPVYKVEKYINKCIDSILNQSFKNFELILVDDGSPDRCGRICDEYKKIDKRIKIIHKTNGGVSDARNYGLDISKGEYISFVDGDDFLEEDMYKNLYEAIRKNDYDICICGINEIDEYGKALDKYIPKDNSFSEFINRSYVWNKLFKRELFDNHRFKIGKYYEDLELVSKLYLESENITTISYLGYNYVKRDESITSKVDDKILDWLWAYCELKKYMLEKNIMHIYEDEFKIGVKNFSTAYLYHLYKYNIFSLLKKSNYIKNSMEYIGAIDDKKYFIFLFKRIYISIIRFLSYIKSSLKKYIK